MLSASVESNQSEPLVAPSGARDRGNPAYFAGILAVAILVHAIVIGLVAWSELGDRTAGATAAVEIPVEMATAEEANGRAEMRQAEKPPGAPAAIEPRDDQPRKPAEGQPQQAGPKGETAQPGKVVERPKDSELPQAARTRAPEARPDEIRPDETRENAANPFGGLASVEKPAPVEPTPTFLSPQSTTATARPRPAQDPTNDNYRAKVLGKVAANMIDPERPRPKALAIVGFRVDAQGGLESVWLARPSGHADLDAEAVDMVRRSAPFPPPPAGADHNFGAAIAFGGD